MVTLAKSSSSTLTVVAACSVVVLVRFTAYLFASATASQLALKEVAVTPVAAMALGASMLLITRMTSISSE